MRSASNNCIPLVLFNYLLLLFFDYYIPAQKQNYLENSFHNARAMFLLHDSGSNRTKRRGQNIHH